MNEGISKKGSKKGVRLLFMPNFSIFSIKDLGAELVNHSAQKILGLLCAWSKLHALSQAPAS